MRTLPAFIACGIVLLSLSCASRKGHTDGRAAPGGSSVSAQRAEPFYPPWRHLSQLQLDAELHEEDVARIWGPPDAVEGSGVRYLVYRLADRSALGLRFDTVEPYGLVLAVLTDSEGRNEKAVFETEPERPNTPP